MVVDYVVTLEHQLINIMSSEINYKEKYNKLLLDIRQTLVMSIEFPFSQICKHLVAASLLSILEEDGEQDIESLANAIVNAYDCDALELLKEKYPELNYKDVGC